MEEKRKTIINRAPSNLNEYIGNTKIKQILQLTISAFKETGLVPNHTLVTGERGLGKTTLATLVAKELNFTYRVISANAIEKVVDLTELLINNPQMLIIDEIHRIKPQISDLLHESMDNFTHSFTEKDGRIEIIELEPFCLWGLTTDEGLLTPAFYSRFVKKHHLEPYSSLNLQKIVMNVAKNNKITIDTPGAWEIAIRSNGVPRSAIAHLINVYEFALKHNAGTINQNITKAGLELHDIDNRGLNEVQRKILKILSRSQTPLGANNLAEMAGIGIEGLTRIYEPFLISSGFIKRLTNGRTITPAGRAHLHKK